MTTKTAMLTGAAAIALAGGALVTAPAIADPIPAARSYADLLEPVPDAQARIHADDEMAAHDAHMIPAQLNIGIGVGGPHHHHHHHHRHSARWYRAHGFFWNGRAWIPAPPPPPFHHHHHHHHHHHNWR